VRVGKHECSGQIVPRDEAVALTFSVLSFNIVKGLLNVKVWILEQKLSFLFDQHLGADDLLPEYSI